MPRQSAFTFTVRDIGRVTRSVWDTATQQVRPFISGYSNEAPDRRAMSTIEEDVLHLTRTGTTLT